MSGLQTLHLMPIPLALTAGIFPVVFYMLLDRLPPIWPSSKKAMMIGPKQPQDITSFKCPYSYIRQIYGKYHWAPFIHKVSPGLKDTNPKKYKWILEVMDTIHLCLMMVDDVSRQVCSFQPRTANTARYLITAIFGKASQQRIESMAHRKQQTGHTTR